MKIKTMMYFLFNIAILQMAYQYKVNEVQFFGNFLVFYFWFCFALMLLASVCINACRKNGTIRKPHFKNVAESQLPFGEQGFIGFELAVSCLLAVFGLRERGGKVKAMVVTATTKESLQRTIADNVEKGSTVYTDDHRSYLGLQGYDHSTVNHSVKEYVNGMAHTNGIESVWALLKWGYNGVYHNMSVKHLGRYVHEFTFRLNKGNCSIDMIDRMELLGRAFGNKRLTYAELIR